MGSPIIDASDAMRWAPETPIPWATDEEREAAKRVCAAHATSAADLRELLQVLGLLPAAEPVARVSVRADVRGPRPTGPRLDADGRVSWCRNGHRMTGDNTDWRGNGSGRWQGRCIKCDRKAGA